MSVPGGPMEIGPIYIGAQPTPLPPTNFGGNYVYLPAGWTMPSSGSSGLGYGMKDLIINQTNISDHEVIASIVNITQSEKNKIEEILAQQKKLTDEDAAKAKQTLDDLARNSPLEYALYLVFAAQVEKKKAQLKLESQKKILAFIESTKEWKFLNDPAGNPYSFSRTFPGPGGSEFTVTHIINSVYQRDVLLKDDYQQTPSQELVANFINQVRLSVRNVLLYIRQQQGEVSKEIARVETEISQLDSQIISAEQARVAAEAVRIANTFRAPGPASAAGPLFMTSAGTVAVVEAAAVTLQAAIRAAITALGGVVASVGAGLVVGVSALFYSSKLANGELPERYAFSTPVSDLASDLGQDLNAVAAAGGTVDLPYRISSKTAADGRSEVFVVKTDGVTVPSKVRVVAATYDATQKIYTATTADVPPRTLTWTPIVNPGNSSTTSPAEQPAPPVYTGATVTPVEGRIDTFPGVADAGFDDFITVFPADSGLPAIYVMFRDRREDPGIATGVGQPVSGIWLGAASQGEGAPIPSQIADQLRGKEFKNFRAFRKAFWLAVGADLELSKQFKGSNNTLIKGGTAPFAIPSEQVGGRGQFEIHHVIPVHPAGAVYDVENMRIMTPKLHIQTHAKKEGL